MTSSASEPLRAEDLSPIARVVGECFGVLYPHTLYQSNIYELLNSVGVQHRNRRITQAQVKAAIGELTQCGAIRDRSSGQRIAHEDWVIPFTQAAHKGGRMDAVIRANKSASYSYGRYQSDAQVDSLARCYLVAGRVDEIDKLDRPERIDWTFLIGAGGGALLPTLPEKYLSTALAACLQHACTTLGDTASLAKMAKQRLSAIPALAGSLAFTFILQGRFADALNLFEEVQVTKQTRIDQACTQAMVACLQGDDAMAVSALELALSEAKSGTRKRLIVPNNPAFIWATFSLMREDTPRSSKRLKSILQTAEKQDQAFDIRRYVDFAFATRSGEPGLPPEPWWLLHMILDGLLCCWLEDDDVDLHESRVRTFVKMLEAADKYGYQWVYQQGTLILEELNMRQHPPANFEAPKRPNEDAPALNLQSLTTALRSREPWEYSLLGLEQLVDDKKAKKPKTETRQGKKRRLVWELSTEYYGIVLTPREQTATRTGVWSKGRAVSLRRLFEQAAEMDFLLDHDRAAAAKIKTKRNWNEAPHYYLGDAGIFELAGHPHVVSDIGDPVEVVHYDPQLHITKIEDDMLEIRMSPHGDAHSGSYHIAYDNQRVEVTRFTSRHRQIMEMIPPEGLCLPESARSRLLDAVSALASDIQVHSSIPGLAATAQEVNANSQPLVRLLPSGTGLSISVVVEPVEDSGVYLSPGVGATTVIAHQFDSVIQTTRDLPQELERLRALCSACPLLAAASDEHPLILRAPVDCLELLDSLQRVDARCLWPEGQKYKIVAQLEPSSFHLEIKSAAQWFEASGRLQVDDQLALELARLFELLDTQSTTRFVEIEKGAFVALSETFRRQLEDLRSIVNKGAKGVLKIHPLAALALDELTDQADVSGDAKWREHCERIAKLEMYDAKLPSTLDTELRPYQEEGFRWLARLAHWGVGACLADDMGLGKTVQALSLLLHRAKGGPALVVAPTSVVGNWLQEANRFAPALRSIVYGGPPDSRTALLDDLGSFDLVIMTYGLLHNDIDHIAQIQWHSAVLDEAQAIKNAATKRARAVRRLDAEFRLVTTGTPVQNNVGDLHSLFGFINPGLLGTEAHFRREFLLPIERDRNDDARGRLRRLIAPFILRRRKNEVLQDLPPRTEITLQVELSTEEAALYEALRQQAIRDLQRSKNRESGVGAGAKHLRVLAHLTKLRLACCHPQLVLQRNAPPSSKLQAFAGVLDELLQNRHKVLVFSQFVRHLRLIEAHLKEAKIAYQYLDGGTPEKKRRKRIAAFQSGEGDVFLISLKAGGMGLNLTAADYVIHMDPWWNPAVEDQASDRAHRIGQTRPVTIYRLITRGTIEEQIVELHHHKRDVANRLLEGTDAAARMDTEDLIALLQGQGA